MRPSETFDDFGGRQMLRFMFWLGMCVLSGLMWGGIILIGLTLYGLAMQMQAVPV